MKNTIETLTRYAELADGRARSAELTAHLAGVAGEARTRATELRVAEAERAEAARCRAEAAALGA